MQKRGIFIKKHFGELFVSFWGLFKVEITICFSSNSKK